MKQHILLLIAIALLFAGTSDVPSQKGGDVSPSNDSTVQGTDAQTPSAGVEKPTRSTPVSDFVHSIVLGQFDVIGSCVSIGDGEYVTAKHLFEGKSNPRVMIADHVVTAKVMHRLADISDVVTDGQEPGVAVADEMPTVGSRVQLYGLATAQVQRGRLGDGYVVVDDGPGVSNGDSGGGVFTEDGKLIGVISAFYGSRLDGTANQRQVYFAAVTRSAPAASGALLDKPRITILSPATWDCQHCPGHRDQDWSAFEVTFEKRDGLEYYPCTEWTDSRGVIRRLYGKRTPKQVMWSWKATQ